jgi:hypothetical protein
MRVRDGQTENPDTLAKIAEGFGVPVSWMRGERDLATDFALEALSRPLQERVMFLWKRETRLAYAITFLHGYDPAKYTIARIAELTGLPESRVIGTVIRRDGVVGSVNIDRLCTETGLPADWCRTGLIGLEDEDELLFGLATHVLANLAEAVGAEVTREEIEEAASALI